MVTPINSLELGLPPGNFPLQTGTLGGRRVKPNHTLTVFRLKDVEINQQIHLRSTILKSVTYLPHMAPTANLQFGKLADASQTAHIRKADAT